MVLWLWVPFFGTALGALAVFFLREGRREGLQRLLRGFAAGVMTAASVWSLLLPALARSEHLGQWAFLPAVLGFWAGDLLLQLTDRLFAQWKLREQSVDQGTRRMLLAVVLHNLPEGMAVGAAFAAVLAGEAAFAGAAALSLGIAIQNLPEGAIVSLPLHAGGMPKGKACLLGVLSGGIEPVGAILTLVFAGLLTPMLPFFLSFAAGAMLTVVIEELAPSFASGKGRRGIWGFTLGFTLMMALDVALG